MSAFLALLEESIEQLEDIIGELETTHGGQKYIPRLIDIVGEMKKEQ